MDSDAQRRPGSGRTGGPASPAARKNALATLTRWRVLGKQAQGLLRAWPGGAPAGRPLDSEPCKCSSAFRPSGSDPE